MVQWLRVCLPMQGTRVRAPVWEGPTCCRAAGPMSHGRWACASGACAPQRERPQQWEVHVPTQKIIIIITISQILLEPFLMPCHSKCSTCIISFNPHDNPKRYLLLLPFDGGENLMFREIHDTLSHPSSKRQKCISNPGLQSHTLNHYDILPLVLHLFNTDFYSAR